MSQLDFFSLKCGVVISNRFNPEKYYVIDMEDVFGTTNKENIVFNATEIDGYKQIRIFRDKGMLNKKLYILISLLIVTCIVFGSAVVYADSNNEVNYDEISSQIENDVYKYHIPGMAVIVVNKDEILFSETYGDCESLETPFIIGSMSKSFTALSIMQLVEDGKIELE